MKLSTRRSFIKNTAIISTASLGLPTTACSQSPKSKGIIKNKLGVALLGLGYYSTDLLAPALQLTNHCTLKGIVTGSPEKIPLWQQKYNIPDANIYNYDNMHFIADNDEIDVIYIVVPTGLHMKYAVAAANTGKHVWCEKPMALDVDQCQKIIKACKKNRVYLSIGYRVQHEPNMQEMIRLTREKIFGNVIALTAHAGYNGGGGNNWRFRKALGGGALYDMGVYTINALRHASQMEPISVLSAYQSTNRPAIFYEVDETTEYLLEFANGIKGLGRTSVGENINALEVTCSDGSYNLSPMQAYNGLRGMRSDGIEIYTRIENQQARQMDNDAMAIINSKEVLVPGIDGLKDIRVLNAIQRSVQSGARVTI